MICRLCGSSQLQTVASLGTQALAGIFPRAGERVPRYPLEVVACSACTLAQLTVTAPPAQQFCGPYGYRSGLNETMVTHLQRLAAEAVVRWGKGRPQAVLDIGCNDGTLLAALPQVPVRVGIDPGPWLAHCPAGITRVPAFYPDRRAPERTYDLIFTVAMFYDLEQPTQVAQAIRGQLATGGHWVCEVADWPRLVRQGVWDGICHEHLTYWTDEAMLELAARADLQVVEVSRNGCNGGSTRYTLAAQTTSGWKQQVKLLPQLTIRPRDEEYAHFQQRIGRGREALLHMLDTFSTVHLYGASTKANVVLQVCELGPDRLAAAAERSPEKVGRFTATGIPIVSEAESRAQRPDAYVVGPWHFRDAILRREQATLAAGTQFIFPLPACTLWSAAPAMAGV
jgi:hypothetical protein